ncbi:MAG: zincin-like metallopeptidase domain-containing protein [Sterolibacterium sp.]
MNPAEYRKQLTARIIEQLEAGTAPWIKPWNPANVPAGSPFNAITMRNYQGGNRLWLDCQSYADPRWCTYKQAAENNWQVRKGERASVVEYWQWEKEEKDANGNRVRLKLDVPRVYYAHIFNVSQMEGVPERMLPVSVWHGDLQAEKILANSEARIIHDQRDAAFYAPRTDEIHLPPKPAFENAPRYYATALHELGHWTGHSDRLNRDLVHKFGTADYAREELRAEMASYFVSSNLGIAHDPGQHASYIASWIVALRKDHNELFRAAKDAEQISDYVLQFSKEKQVERYVEEELEC